MGTEEGQAGGRRESRTGGDMVPRGAASSTAEREG